VGDSRRFDLFAKLVSESFPCRDQKIADVAGGKGILRWALGERGYKTVTSWDKRHNNAKGRPNIKWGYFKQDLTERYDLVVGMHPDGATDHIIQYAIRNKVPFVICPCCVIPSAVAYWNQYNFGSWLHHLNSLALKGGMTTEITTLKMNGRNMVLIGRI
jgi:hypothetical protein